MKAARAATSLKITGVIELLDLAKTELLSKVLLEIARLPATPSTVTRLLEEMNSERVIAVVQDWVIDGHIQELGLVLDGASEDMLNMVTGNLDNEDQLKILPSLRSETFAQIDPALLILPDLSVTDVSVKKIGSGIYRVSVTIRNTGVGNAAFDVTMMVDDAKLDLLTVDELLAEEERIVKFEWEPETVGTFRIRALVDAENDVFEIKEDDNTGHFDLVIENPQSMTGVYLVAAVFVLAIGAIAYRKFR